MASITPGKSADRNQVELNLVPFIDLLSTLTLFLLISAVWVQVASLPAGTQEAASGNPSAAAPATVPRRLSLHITASGYELTWPEGTASTAPRFLATADIGQLAQHLSTERAQIPDGVAISAHEAVPYGDVVQAIDGTKQAGVEAPALNLYRN